VEADHGFERRPVACQFERGLSAHAEAHRGKPQALRLGQGRQRLEPRAQAAAIGERIRADFGSERAGLVEAGGAFAVEVGDQREIARFGEGLGLRFDRGRRIHDRRKREDCSARTADRSGEQPGQRGFAVFIVERFEFHASAIPSIRPAAS
jgi:hypothetical protein